MSLLRSLLAADAAALLTLARRKSPRTIHADLDEAVQRLLDWSDLNDAALSHRPPNPGPTSDPLVGVDKAGTKRLVWRLYPGDGYGAKIALHVGAQNSQRVAARTRIVAIIDALSKKEPIAASNKLELDLARIASSSTWSRFAVALDCSLAFA